MLYFLESEELHLQLGIILLQGYFELLPQPMTRDEGAGARLPRS
jgi:hypothetical protein